MTADEMKAEMQRRFDERVTPATSLHIAHRTAVEVMFEVASEAIAELQKSK